MRPLPAVDLSHPGWRVHTGQAVWHLAHGKAEIAGEITVANRSDGETLVQFSKTPFPLVLGRANSRRWSVEFPSEHKHYAGPGAPPKRIIWLYLPRALAALPLPKGWSWNMNSNGWRLENPKTAESIEGYFDDTK